jgi:photosystem II stability/assembly factor-like uncharacterized protein
MKKTTILFFLFFLSASLLAQTPQFYNYNTAGGDNSFPLNQGPGKMVQWLVLAGEFNMPTPATSGNITSVFFRISSTYPLNSTYTSFRLLLGQTTITSLTSGTFYSGTMDTVYYRASVSFSPALGSWMEITLDHSFSYNPAQSLVIQMEQCASTQGTGYSLTHTTVAGNRRVWSVGGCPFTPYASAGTNVINCGITVSTVIPNGWSRQNPSGVTTSLNTVSVANANVGWIGGNGGVVLRTINAGTNWANVTGSPIGTADVYAICGIDANTCLVTTTPNATFVYRTTNGGVNWTQVFTQAAGFIDDIKFQNANTGYMYGDPVGARWSLWKSTNGGLNWDSAGLYLPQAGSEAGWNNAMWLSGNNLWFGTNNTRVYKSTNFGSAWTFGATTGSVNTYSVAFDGLTGFTGQSALLKSTNGGDNYSAVTLPGTGTAYSFNAVLGRYWYCRTTNIYWSSDNGANFALQFPDTGTYLAMNMKLDGNIIRGWAVTSNGRISRYHELISGISNNQNNMPENYSLKQNYPNPFNPSTKISFSLPKAGDVKLIVFDILGREVATLIDGFTGAGNHTVDFNASNLSSGVYLYKIQAGDFTETRKMILMK